MINSKNKKKLLYELEVKLVKFVENIRFQSDFANLQSQESKNTFFDNLESGIKICIKEILEKTDDDNSQYSNINVRQIKVLEYLNEFDSISRREYAITFGVSFMTAFRDLVQLEKKGMVSVIGRARGTKYILKP